MENRILEATSILDRNRYPNGIRSTRIPRKMAMRRDISCIRCNNQPVLAPLYPYFFSALVQTNVYQTTCKQNISTVPSLARTASLPRPQMLTETLERNGIRRQNVVESRYTRRYPNRPMTAVVSPKFQIA